MMRRKLRVMAVIVGGSTLLGGVAIAASSPSVVTNGTSSVGQHSAVLHGTVNPNGNSATYFFQWGLTKGYGDNGTPTSAGSGTVSVSVHQTAHNLIPGTIYHYRLVATNQFGTSVGGDRTFKTAGPPPPGVYTGPAVQLSTRGATLTGAVNPSGATTTWYFDWGGTAAYGQRTVSHTLPPGSQAQNVTDSSLQGLLAPGTIYHYRLVAIHTGSATSLGGDGTFMTYPSPRPVPGLAATTRPRRVRHQPYGFTTTGRVIPPSSIPPQYACQGNVTIRFFRGARQVRFTLAGVQPNCTFAAQSVFPRLPRRTRPPVRLRVVIRFVSTPYLATNRAPYRHVTLG
jgi:hypothetical protein